MPGRIMNSSSMQIYCILQKRQGVFIFHEKYNSFVCCLTSKKKLGKKAIAGWTLIKVLVVFFKVWNFKYRHPLFFQGLFLFLGCGSPDLLKLLGPVMHFQRFFGKG